MRLLFWKTGCKIMYKIKQGSKKEWGVRVRGCCLNVGCDMYIPSCFEPRIKVYQKTKYPYVRQEDRNLPPEYSPEQRWIAVAPRPKCGGIGKPASSGRTTVQHTMVGRV